MPTIINRILRVNSFLVIFPVVFVISCDEISPHITLPPEDEIDPKTAIGWTRMRGPWWPGESTVMGDDEIEDFDMRCLLSPGVYGYGSDRFFTVRCCGSIPRYDGSDWRLDQTGTLDVLCDIWGVSEDFVFAVGMNGVIFHYDGYEWTQMEGVSRDDLYAVWGTSHSNAYAVGENGIIIHFDGTKWRFAAYTGTRTDLRGIWGTSADDIIAVGSAGIYRFDGEIWEEMPAGGSYPLYCVWGSSPDDYYAGGYMCLLHYDGDGWTDITESVYGSFFPYFSIEHIRGTSSNEIYAVSRSYYSWQGIRTVYFTGSNWVPLTGAECYALWGDAESGLHGLADQPWVWSGGTCGGSIIHFDEGQWTKEKLPVCLDRAQDLHSVWGTDDGDIFTAGDGGTILHYGGESWEKMETPVETDLRSIWGCPGCGVIAVGDDGCILMHYNDEWHEIDSGVTNDLYGVWGCSFSDIYAVGDGGLVLRFDGSSWKEMESIHRQRLLSIWGSGPEDIWIGGDDYAKIHCDGEVIEYFDFQELSSVYDIWGNSESDVYAVGRPGRFIHFDGIEWRYEDIRYVQQTIDCVGGDGEEMFYAVADGFFSPKFMYRKDGTWFYTGSASFARIEDIWVSPSGMIYLVGANETILRGQWK